MKRINSIIFEGEVFEALESGGMLVCHLSNQDANDVRVVLGEEFSGMARKISPGVVIKVVGALKGAKDYVFIGAEHVEISKR